MWSTSVEVYCLSRIFALHSRFEFLRLVDKVFARKFDPATLNPNSLWYSSSDMSFHSYYEL